MKEKTCCLLWFSAFADDRGKLTAIEGGRTIPFEIRRIFFLYDLTPGAVRGDHATMNDQCIVAVAGSCRIYTHDGEKETVYDLDGPMCGLYVPAMIWRRIFDCSDGCVLAVLSDKHYSPEDYVRDFDTYLRLRTDRKNAGLDENANR